MEAAQHHHALGIGDVAHVNALVLVFLVKEYEKNENECVYMCDIANPKGMMVLGSFHSKENLNRFFSRIKSSVKGVEITRIDLSKVVLGSMGQRDFDMRYSSQYKCLERKKMVPSMKERPQETPVENPDVI